MAARRLRDELLARRGRGETVAPDSRLRLGEAADVWLAGPVLDLRPATQAGYRSAVEQHLRPRYGNRRLETITADELATLVRDMRNQGKSEATIAAVLGAAGRIYKFAARRLGFSGVSPTTLMLSSERPKVSLAKRLPIFAPQQIEQTLAASTELYRTLFTVAALTAPGSRRCAGSPGQTSISRTSTTPRLTQQRATDDHGRPTFPVLHQTDQDGNPRPAPAGSVPSLHSFRHTVASRALLAGETVDEVAFLLGHRDATVTRVVYIREIADARRRHMRRSRMTAEYAGALRIALDGDGSS